jgi:hypothetical protein
MSQQMPPEIPLPFQLPLRKGGGLVDAPGRGLVGANTENPH